MVYTNRKCKTGKKTVTCVCVQDINISSRGLKILNFVPWNLSCNIFYLTIFILCVCALLLCIYINNL
jgi:hypothetical protein